MLMLLLLLSKHDVILHKNLWIMFRGSCVCESVVHICEEEKKCTCVCVYFFLVCGVWVPTHVDVTKNIFFYVERGPHQTCLVHPTFFFSSVVGGVCNMH